ncbi:MAG: DedA family protein [Rhodospirillaceae bacterium]|nr:DedA family protein [Rhodospirillaceae bacterium]
MEQWIIDFVNTYGHLIYILILVWTFLEGETIVLVIGTLISSSAVHLNIWLLILFAILGSFGGDQTWFYIGRSYGMSILKRWPSIKRKVGFVLKLLRRQETFFILSFRFIYGLRNISPFIIGMTGVSRTKFVALNFIASIVWANTFAWGGYSLGSVFETYFGTSSHIASVILIIIILFFATINWFRQRKKNMITVTVSDKSSITDVIDDLDSKYTN